jgi:hypothetical protein
MAVGIGQNLRRPARDGLNPRLEDQTVSRIPVVIAVYAGIYQFIIVAMILATKDIKMTLARTYR